MPRVYTQFAEKLASPILVLLKNGYRLLDFAFGTKEVIENLDRLTNEELQSFVSETFEKNEWISDDPFFLTKWSRSLDQIANFVEALSFIVVLFHFSLDLTTKLNKQIKSKKKKMDTDKLKSIEHVLSSYVSELNSFRTKLKLSIGRAILFLDECSSLLNFEIGFKLSVAIVVSTGNAIFTNFTNFVPLGWRVPV